MHDSLSEKEYQAVLRNDLGSFIERCFRQVSPGGIFIPGQHIELIAYALELCRTGAIKRLIVNIPPRNLKSISASVAFPAYILGHDPTKEIICVSYAQDLANKHASDCRAVMQSPWYQQVFPTRIAGRGALQELTTTKGGGRLATSVGGVLTGRGADIIVIDDPLKPDEALSDTTRQNANRWFDNTLLSRLNDKQNGCIIIIMQRLHEDDLVGHVLGEDWYHVSLPAIAEQEEYYGIETALGTSEYVRGIGETLHPEREPIEVLQRIQASMGEYDFAGQYQQRPAPVGGGLVKAAWFQYYDTPPEKFDRIIQSWDTASKNTELADYSVCTTWGMLGQQAYLLHVLREKMDFPDLKRAAIAQFHRYQPKVIVVEDQASGIQLMQELRRERIWQAKPFKPDSDKVIRMHNQSVRIESGLVFLPRRALWLDTYLHEMLTFPNGRYDDQVDSTSQALAWLDESSRRRNWHGSLYPDN